MTTAPRSVLAVPASSHRFITSALTSRSDALMLDIEDGVAPGNKADARTVVEEVLLDPTQARDDVWVRINAADTDQFPHDVQLLRRINTRSGQLTAVLPMATRRSIERLSGSVPDVRIMAMIETAVGVEQASAVAGHDHVDGVMFGELDFRADMNAVGALRFDNTRWAHSAVINAAAAVRKWVIAGPFAALQDSAGLERVTQDEARLGFAGKLCIHPSQIDAVNSGFSPDDAQTEWAHSLLAELEGADTPGAFRFRGQMVDAPVIARAREILRFHQVHA